MTDIFLAGKLVLSQRGYFFSMVLLTIAIFLLFLAIPVKTVPGNTFAFQLSILDVRQYILLGALSFLIALSLTLHIFALMHKRSMRTGVSMAGQSATGFLSGTIASIFGTATCAYCVSAFFGFLGIGGVLFLIEQRTWITAAAIVLMLILLYFTSRKVLGICEVCR